MSNTKRKKILNYRNNNGLAPNPDNIDYGEIAIGYKKDSEAIYIKNTANGIVDFTPISIVNLTYNELKELRDNSKLKPSQYYRITDFVTTVANDPEAQSAGHPFDIIVMASEKNKLQEECYAIQHEGDPYFANCNLAAWKIWYCLDNDTTKYAWADTANGKGVIYRMIDEWQNDCPYDFKNVQFKRYWANGINITKKEGEPKDIILQGYYGTVTNTDIFTEGIDTNDYLYCFTFTRLNNILANYEKGSVIQSNVLDESIQTEGFDIDAVDDKLNIPNAYNFHNRCRNNILRPTETGLVVDTAEYMAFALLNNVFITVKIVDEYEAYQPPFDNTLGVSCVNNTFGSNIYGLSFLSRCVNNTFGNDCFNNTFGNDCGSNSFGNYCYGNSFGNNCNSNSFGNNCNGNSFGNDCGSNSFGNYCFGNSFGNDCVNNSFGNNCLDNTFGNYCYHNSFGNYFKYNALGNNIQYIEIPTEKIYNTQILNGTRGTDTKHLTIEFTSGTTYSQFAGFTSDGVLKIWVEADDIVNITYNELKNLRDNSKLKPSQYYRITDFVTTVANDPKAQSAGHPFDIIVMASEKDKLQDECYAIQHEGNTYFDNCNLAAWKIWYCLDNDTTKYMWADTTNGKGVIYRMIDEWQNDCPYDFKNIMFNRTVTAGGLNINGVYYTFSWVNGAKEVEDASIVGQTLTNEEGAVYGVHDNLISACDAGSLGTNINTMAFVLNGNVFVSEYSYDGGFFYGIYGNHFATNCYNNTFGSACYGNTFGNCCNNNSFGNSCINNSFGNYCKFITFGSDCADNSFGNSCINNSFGNSCINNSFGNSCCLNTFGNIFCYNTIGNYVQNIEIPTEKIYHTQILNGTKGTNTKHLTIEFTPQTTYSQFAGFTSNNVLKIWVEADAVDGGSY